MSSDEVRLHRSVSLDQMAEFDPNTGLWHSDGTFEVVRFHEVLPTDGKENVTHIALPIARHAALMRVVAWAESVVGAGEGTPLALCALMNHRKGDYHGALDACPVVERVRADLAATAPGRQGEAPR